VDPPHTDRRLTNFYPPIRVTFRFEQCHAVSLALSQMSGVDTATESLFTVQAASSGKCQIAEADYDLVSTSVTATTTATCMGMSGQNGGLLITSCNLGHAVSIPGPPPPNSTPVLSPSPT
jgi:hypothetical protein